MRSKLKASLLMVGAAVSLALSVSSVQANQLACKGVLFNPIAQTDWNNIFPITIAGVPIGPAGLNPPLMTMPPVCVCPGIFGIPSPGIGITYWQPLYISEIERTPGCLSSLGGISVLPSYGMLQSEKANGESDNSSVTSRMQVHWYEYPLFGVMDLLKSFPCKSPSGFALGYMTELDPTWQDDAWGAIFTPEAALFANPVAQAACSVDATAASAGFPLDPMFWCAGTWGSVYPLTGNAAHSNTDFTTNNLVQAKFLARMARMGLAWQTIGPSAMCYSHPNPVWIKSQYRYNQVFPIPRYGMPVVTGNHGLLQVPSVTNLPGFESTTNLIWQGQQCCARFF